MSSERFNIPSPEVVMTNWTLEDVVDGLAMIDLFDRLAARAAEKARNGAS